VAIQTAQAIFTGVGTTVAVTWPIMVGPFVAITGITQTGGPALTAPPYLTARTASSATVNVGAATFVGTVDLILADR